MSIIEDEDLDTMTPCEFVSMWYQGRCGRRTNLVPPREMEMLSKIDLLLEAVEKAYVWQRQSLGAIKDFDAIDEEDILGRAMELREFMKYGE